MKSARIASFILKLASLTLSLSSFYFQHSRLSVIEKSFSLLSFAMLCLSIAYPKMKGLNLCLLLQSIYSSYCAFAQKKASLAKMNEDQLKHLFLLFFVMFNAVFNDYKTAVYTFYRICLEFRFVVINVFNFAFVLVTGILSFFINDNFALNSSQSSLLKRKEGIGNEKKTQ